RTSALGGGVSKAEAGSVTSAVAATVTYALLRTRMFVNSWGMPVLMTTWRQPNWPWPEQPVGTGYPANPVGGELMLTLFVNPVVAAHGSPPTSNQVAENVPPPETSQAFA